MPRVAPGVLSVPGATLATVDTVSDSAGTLPLTEAQIDAARRDVPQRLGTLPYSPGAARSRSLWVIFLGKRGIWTHAVLPIDDRLDMPDREDIADVCKRAAACLTFPLRHEDEQALVVLRRPAPPALSAADAYIFRLVCAAATERDTAPWTFCVTGPGGAKECFRRLTDGRGTSVR